MGTSLLNLDPAELERQQALLARPPIQPTIASPQTASVTQPVNLPAVGSSTLGGAAPILSKEQKQASLDAAQPTAAPSVPNIASLSRPPDLPAVQKANAPRGTVDGDTQYRTELLNSPPPVSQISSKIENSNFGKNHPTLGKIVGGVAQFGGALGETLIPPGIASRMPGTTIGHNILQAQVDKQLSDDTANAQKEAETKNQEAEAAKRLEPPKEEWAQLTGFTGPNGEPMEYEKNSGQARVALNSAGAKLIPKTPSAGDEPLGASVANLNKTLQDRYSVLHPGQAVPNEYVLPANATSKDYDRIDKALGGVENAEGTVEQRKQTDELRRQGMAQSAQNHQDAMAMAGGKQDAATRGAVYKTYSPVMDSAERYNVMAKNYEDSIKNHDQQAMLSLLYNHMGMTMGLQKGARMTQALISEAQKSQPWLQGMKSKFDDQGYLSGVTLSPQQMQEMVSNARGRYSEDVVKARSQAKYQGATDDGPDRTPNSSVVNYYTHLAGGDPAKAKQLAVDDGWTIH